MKIRHSEMHYTDIDLTDQEVDTITITRLKRIIFPGEYLRTMEDGTIWLMQDEPHWRHGSVSEEKVRLANDLDLAVFKIKDWITRS